MAAEPTLPHHAPVDRVRGLRVEVTAGPDAGQSCAAREDTLTVGSAPGNDLVLSDPTVSRYHLELMRTDQGIALEDHRSTNGTFAGNLRLERAVLAPRTTLRLGRTQLLVDDAEPVAVERAEHDRWGGLIGRSAVMRTLFARVQRAAESDASVLIHGETGCGKELIARAIHTEGRRAAGPFETVDCGALIPSLVASELFGHEKGAFTGAEREHVGAFERADGGTLFLDEIGELPASLQPALLGALERRSFRRVGGQRNVEVDVRVIAATHRDLRADVNAGTFRQDLYFRLAVVPLRVPALRERSGDIPALVEHFLREAGYEGEVSALISGPVMDSLRLYHWPGNVRELRNFVDSALALGETLPLDAPSGAAPPAREESFLSVPLEALLTTRYQDARALVLREFERRYLESLLTRTNNNVSQAARESGINRTYISHMLKRHRRPA